ncbi:MAG: adenosylcobinamide-GDP ribazoletransferase, partial [Pseudomonadales bacterium]|nr:adenosylcobinamide-GDP ribazoletransferase [Pseudomonadales bacterium]
MNPILIALQFLTRLPVKPSSYQDLDLKSSLYWYGLAGFIIGAIQYGFFVGCTLLLPNLSHSVLAVLL